MNIFLDLEWNAKNYELLSIGAIGLDDDSNKQQSFNSLIRPKCIDKLTDRIITFIHSSKEKIISARPLYAVMSSFFKRFGWFEKTEDLVLTVWNRQTYTVFERVVKAIGLKIPQHKVIVLQDILMLIDYANPKCCGLKYYLDKIEYKYDENKMHNSMYDVKVLADVFIHIRKKLIKHFSKQQGELFFLKSRQSDILHKPSCRYGSRISVDNMESIEIFDIGLGCAVCKECYKDVKWRESIFKDIDLRWNYNQKKESAPKVDSSCENISNEFSEENIKAICNQFNLKYRIASNMVYIDTPKSSWIIFHDALKILSLFHKNYHYMPRLKENKKKMVCHEGYHDQGIKLKNLYSACKYINKHDNSPNAYKHKKSRIDELFDIISASHSQVEEML